MLIVAHPMDLRTRRHQIKQIILFIIAAIFLFVSGAWGAEVKLAWGTSTETGVAGYKLHYGTSSGHYTTTINVGSKAVFTVCNLSGGKTYYFAVTAYASDKSESAFSNEVSYTTPTKPTLSSVAICGPSQLGENSSVQYVLTAHYSDGSTAKPSSGISWSENSSAADITSSGLLTSDSVTSDAAVTITASYGGKSDTHSLIVENAHNIAVSDTAVSDTAVSDTAVGDTAVGDTAENCSLTIDILGSGNVLLDPPGGTYVKGTLVTLTAEADHSWAFDGWEGCVSDTASNTTTLLMDTDINVSVSFLEDTDLDNIPDQEEWGQDSLDHDFDGNGDGIADCLQGNVASLHTKDYLQYLTLSVPEPARISSCKALDPSFFAEPPPDYYLPLGMFSYNIEDIAPGDAVALTFQLPAESSTYSTFYKYGATLDNPAAHWYEFAYNQLSETGAVLEGGNVTLYLKDGQQGDDDLTDNGVISADPDGSASADANNPLNSSLSDTDTTSASHFHGSSGCFVSSIFGH